MNPADTLADLWHSGGLPAQALEHAVLTGRARYSPLPLLWARRRKPALRQPRWRRVNWGTYVGKAAKR